MYRRRLLIKRSELISWFTDPNVVKIDLHVNRNLKLKNPEICEIYAYFRLAGNTVNQICGLCGALAKSIDITPHEHAFLNGIQFQKKEGFINTRMVIRIEEIQKNRNINLGITEELRNLVKKYENGKTF